MLNPCPSCQHMVSDHASACPSCGHDFARGSKRSSVALVAILLTLPALIFTLTGYASDFNTFGAAFVDDARRIAMGLWIITGVAWIPFFIGRSR